jgi:SAM-dependent methyltransferase
MTRPTYDGKASTWRDVYRSRDPFSQRIQRRCDRVAEMVCRHLGASPSDILDVGCGTGEAARKLAGHGHRVVGLDSSAEMLAEAVGVAGDTERRPLYVEGTILRLPLPSNRFDAVVCIGVIEHLTVERVDGRATDAEVLALRELKRVLRPGGILLVWAPGADPAVSIPDLTRRRTPGGMRRRLAAEGLHPVEWAGVGFGPFTLLGRRVISADRSVSISARLERLSGRFPFRYLGRLAGTWLLALRADERE